MGQETVATLYVRTKTWPGILLAGRASDAAERRAGGQRVVRPGVGGPRAPIAVGRAPARWRDVRAPVRRRDARAPARRRDVRAPARWRDVRALARRRDVPVRGPAVAGALEPENGARLPGLVSRRAL